MSRLRNWCLRTLSLVTAFVSLSSEGLLAQPGGEPVAAGCGQVVAVETHGRTTTRFALTQSGTAAQGAPAALVLLVGGGGHLNLDGNGCPRTLKGNFLVRSRGLFNGAGFATALVDAPSDHPGEDGLKGFRIAPQHADDLGKVIADLRKRTSLPVWLVGTSRGTLSAANAAVRLAGSVAPDGVVLTSAITAGGKGGHRPWVAQTVFDLGLEAIKAPLLVVGHAADACIRTPAALMADVAARASSTRKQVATVTGGPRSTASGLDACEPRTPHGFLGQEPAVVAGIARFVRGGRY